MAHHAWTRGPIIAPRSAANEEWSQFVDWVNGHQITVIDIAPLRADAPLPPGLSRWPAPGGALLSPALAHQGKAAGIITRYGRFSGTIANAGLISPGELLAYVRPPTNRVPQHMFPISGYGSPMGDQVGDAADLANRPEWMLQLLVWSALILPILVLVFVAVRISAHGRDRRTALIASLGGRDRDRAMITLGELSIPVGIGGLVGALAVLPPLASEVFRIPYVGFVVSATDLRSCWPLMCIALLVAVGTVLAMGVAGDRAPSRRGTSVRPVGRSGFSRLWAALCVLMLLVATRGPDFVSPNSPLHLLINYVGIAGFLATLPAVLALVCAPVGLGLARLGRTRGKGGLILAGRRMASHPGNVGRLVAGILVAIVLLIQVQVWYSLLGDQVLTAERVDAQLGGGVATALMLGEPSAGQVKGFIDALPADIGVVAFTNDPRDNSPQITGKCTELRYLSLPCPTTPKAVALGAIPVRTGTLVAWESGQADHVRVSCGDPVTLVSGAAGYSQLVIVAPEGSELPLDRLRTAAFQSLPGGAAIAAVGETWTSPALAQQHQGRWIVLAGLFGVVALTLAIGLNGLAEFLRLGRALGPVSVLTGRRSVLFSTAAWTVFVPMALAGTASIIAGTWLAQPMVAQGRSYVSNSLLYGCVIAVVSVALLLWLWGAATAGSENARWRPGNE
jgi:hypothetical protein